MRRAWARAVVRARYLIVAVWIAGAVLATLFLPSVDQAGSGALGDLVPADAPALEAELRSSELFGFPVLSRTVLVQRAPDGLSREAQLRVLARAAGLSLGRLERFRESVPGALALLNVAPAAAVSRERATAALTYLIFDPDIGRTGQVGLAHLLVERTAQPGDGVVGVTGALPARRAQGELIRDALPLVELLTVLLVAFAVGVHFRAVLAPLVNLLVIAVAYLVAIRLVAAGGKTAGVAVPKEVEPVIVALLFGVLTDYAVFFFSRLRRHLAGGADARSAAEATMVELGPTILTAGATIVLASAGLLVAELGFVRAFGPGMAVAVAVALAAALTFLPALLAIFGAALFWPRGPAPGAERGPERGSPALRLAAARPWATVVVCSVVLLAAASGVLRMDVGQTLIRGLPAGSEPRVAYEAAAQGFVPGVLSPSVVVVEGPGIAQRRRALRRMRERIEALPGVAAVVGPTANPLRMDLGAVRSVSGDAVRYLVVFEGDPLGAQAIRNVRTLRRFLPDVLEAGGLPAAGTSVAGDTALAEETVSAAGSDVGRVAPVTLLAVLLVLAVFLRALVAPLYLVLASVLGLAAALGLTVFLFQDLLGHGELTFYVPFMAAVLLLALGSDYNVFLAGRIWDEARERPLREAVAVAGARAARAITVAGIVLAGSFALMALVPVRPFRELAFAMTCGLLLDAFLVRTLLVPALIAAVGRR